MIAVVFSARTALAEEVVLRVRVTGLKLAALRLRCALPLIWLAAKVAGTGFHVQVDPPVRTR